MAGLEAQWITRTQRLSPVISAQNEYNLLDRRIERELVPACSAYGVGVLPYFPLASGFLTGKYRPGEAPPEGSRIAAWGARGEQMLTDRNFEILQGLESFAQSRDKSMLELAFGWLASQSQVPSVIAGATKPEQVEQNVAAAGWKLTSEELTEVDTITKSK